MKSHSFLLLHILTLIYSWKSIAQDAREKGKIGHQLHMFSVDIAVMLCLMYVMFVTL